jgi:hypothetical protein
MTARANARGNGCSRAPEPLFKKAERGAGKQTVQFVAQAAAWTPISVGDLVPTTHHAIVRVWSRSPRSRMHSGQLDFCRIALRNRR